MIKYYSILDDNIPPVDSISQFQMRAYAIDKARAFPGYRGVAWTGFKNKRIVDMFYIDAECRMIDDSIPVD